MHHQDNQMVTFLCANPAVVCMYNCFLPLSFERPQDGKRVKPTNEETEVSGREHRPCKWEGGCFYFFPRHRPPNRRILGACQDKNWSRTWTKNPHPTTHHSRFVSSKSEAKSIKPSCAREASADGCSLFRIDWAGEGDVRMASIVSTNIAANELSVPLLPLVS